MRRAAALYLVIESTGIVVWWVALVVSPAVRRHFVAAGAPDAVLLAFAPADLLLVLTGLLAARSLQRPSKSGARWLCAHAAMAVYAGLYAVGLPLAGGGAWLGALFMVPVLLISPAIAWRFAGSEER
jgi:hypothetical protein